MTWEHYTLRQIVEHLVKSGELHYEIEHFGSSRDNPAHREIAVYQVTLQGNLISTQPDRFDYEHDGPPEPFPDPVEVLSDLMNFAVYPYRQKTRDGFKEGVQNFVAWMQATCTQRQIKVFPPKSIQYNPLSLDDLREQWEKEWEEVDRMEQAIGRDVLKMIMEAER